MSLCFKLIFKSFLIPFMIFYSSHAWSASCHGGGGGETTVLSAGQKIQVGMANSFRVIEGFFDPYGRYTSTRDDDSSLISFATTWNAGVRASESWQWAFAFPVINNFGSYSGQNHSKTSIGDPVLETRYTLWEDLGSLSLLPEINGYVGARFPLGTSVYTSLDSRGLDVVGDGVSTLHLGWVASKLVRPVKVSLSGSFYYPWEKQVTKMRGVSVASPYSFKSGNRVFLEESAGYLISNHWNTAFGLRQLWTLKSKMAGNTVEGSAQRLFSTLMTLGYTMDVSLNMALSYETPFPFYRYVANQANSHLVSFAIQYGIF